MEYPKILTIQDISCYGQCSITVALPILSACQIETAIMPSAVLSTHTTGFKEFMCQDLTSFMPEIYKHWNRENIKFDGIYTGYLGSKEQIEIVKKTYELCAKKDAKLIVDPAMADNGKLYPAFDMEFVSFMKELVDSADIIIPNITEACLLTNSKFENIYDEEYILDLCQKLDNTRKKIIVITGVSFDTKSTGVYVYESGKAKYYAHEKLSKGSHGTGDVFASAFVGALYKDKSAYEAAKIAADYTLACIKRTLGDKNHTYGVKFELELPNLIHDLNCDEIYL